MEEAWPRVAAILDGWPPNKIVATMLHRDSRLPTSSARCSFRWAASSWAGAFIPPG